MIQFDSTKNNNTGNHDHNLDKNQFNDLFNIISKCHPNLKRELLQHMENKDIKREEMHQHFYQFHLDSKSKEVVFAFRYVWKNREVIAPLILDLNHSVCKVDKKKPYRYVYQKSWEDWDLKEQQEEIKNSLNQFLGQIK